MESEALSEDKGIGAEYLSQLEEKERIKCERMPEKRTQADTDRTRMQEKEADTG